MNIKTSLYIIVLFISFVFIGCNGRLSSDVQEERSGEIVLIFNQHDLDETPQKSIFNNSNRVSFYNDSLNLLTHIIDSQHENDTLWIETAQEILNFKLMHKNISYHYFFFPGDTIFFNYQDGNPMVSSSNPTLSTYDLNLSRYIKERFHEDLQSKGLIVGIPAGETRESLFDQFILKNKGKSIYLDSLQNESLIRDDVHRFFSAAVRTALYFNVIFPKSFTYPLEKVSITEIDEFAAQPDYLNQVFFHDFLIRKYFVSDPYKMDKITQSQGWIWDYKDGYDKIKANLPPSEIKDWLLFYTVKQIQENDSREAFANYLSIYQEDVQNPLLSVNIDIPEDENSVLTIGKSVMTSLDRSENIDFQKYLNDQKGNVVYVDLWASWCVPCRIAMPASKDLIDYFEEKPIKFLYLSLDEKFNNWSQAVKEENLSSHPDNYLFVEPKQAELLSQLQVRTIPRYLIFDKSGNLVNVNAPGPNSPDLRSILEELL